MYVYAPSGARRECRASRSGKGVYIRADVKTHTSSILLGDLPCGAFHLYAALYCCGVFAAQIYVYISICIYEYMYVCIQICIASCSVF